MGDLCSLYVYFVYLYLNLPMKIISLLTKGIYHSINLYNKMDIKKKKKLFTVSIIYLTLLQLTYLIDKIYLWI